MTGSVKPLDFLVIGVQAHNTTADSLERDLKKKGEVHIPWRSTYSYGWSTQEIPVRAQSTMLIKHVNEPHADTFKQENVIRQNKLYCTIYSRIQAACIRLKSL